MKQLNAELTYPRATISNASNLQENGSRHWNPNRNNILSPTKNYDRKHRIDKVKTHQNIRTKQQHSFKHHCSQLHLSSHPPLLLICPGLDSTLLQDSRTDQLPRPLQQPETISFWPGNTCYCWRLATEGGCCCPGADNYQRSTTGSNTTEAVDTKIPRCSPTVSRQQTEAKDYRRSETSNSKNLNTIRRSRLRSHTSHIANSGPADCEQQIVDSNTNTRIIKLQRRDTQLNKHWERRRSASSKPRTTHGTESQTSELTHKKHQSSKRWIQKANNPRNFETDQRRRNELPSCACSKGGAPAKSTRYISREQTRNQVHRAPTARQLNCLLPQTQLEIACATL